jgi:1-acyl-sn-glycerol-3-phosphate acyltransferase
LAAQPGAVVGLHPEGKRSKTDDPYTLLPAQIGAGQVVHAARPVVVPVFVLGMTNDFVRQVRSNFDGSGEPITVSFGAPVELQDLLQAPARLRTYKRIADRLRDEIMLLGQQQRAMRQSLLQDAASPEPAAGASRSGVAA